jgi:hypothetical protein
MNQNNILFLIGSVRCFVKKYKVWFHIHFKQKLGHFLLPKKSQIVIKRIHKIVIIHYGFILFCCYGDNPQF